MAAAPQPATASSRTFRFPLPPHPIAVEQSRILVRLALSEWNVSDLADNTLIITAELVANAARIGDVFHLTLSRQDGTVLVEVSDSSEATPGRQRHSFDRVDGRGRRRGGGGGGGGGGRRGGRGGGAGGARGGGRGAGPRGRS